MIYNSFSSENFSSKLNDKQIEAVEHDKGPLLVLAGAGTGKTTVLTHRIFSILNKNIAKPSNILAMTFTNKASNEMQNRLKYMIQEEVNYLSIGTFHSVALKILRPNISFLKNKIDSNFTIIDQAEQILCIKNIMLQENIDIKFYLPKIIYTIIMRLKDKNVLPETALLQAQEDRQVDLIAKRIYPLYQAVLQKSNLLDFGDILLYSYQLLLTNESLLRLYQEKFQYVHVDEYQDTNLIQYLFLKLIVDKGKDNIKNICCVGDDDQSIYGWRGAELSHILRFEKDFPNAKIIKLEENYRSSKSILQGANSLISNNKTRYKKLLWTGREIGNKIKIISCIDEFDESNIITSLILKLKQEKKLNNNSDQYAILVRSSFQTRAFEEAFIAKAIPYKIIGSIRFYERAEIKDIVSYIRLSINYNDDLALERIINKPRRSIGVVTLNKIKKYAIENKISMFGAIEDLINKKFIRSETTLKNLKDFIELIKFLNFEYKNSNHIETTNLLLSKSKYLDFLSNSNVGQSEVMVENINEMLRAISDFTNIYQFIEHISLVTENPMINDVDFMVSIMTIHAAKGLEFDAVFLSGWEEGIFPNQKALSDEKSLGLEEERRLAYVSMTRAKKELYITYAQTRRLFKDIIQSVPSRFIKEIPEKNVILLSSNEMVENSFSNIQEKSFSGFYNRKKQIYMQQKPQAQKETNKSLLLGRRVEHSKFGHGVIVKAFEDNLEIVFEKIGLKTVKKCYVTVI